MAITLSLNKLKFILKTHQFKIGVFEEDEFKIVEVDILNTDNTITKHKMTVKDVMYFTEYGTMTIPGKHILRKTKLLLKPFIKNCEIEIIRNYAMGKVNDKNLIDEINIQRLKIQSKAQEYFSLYINDHNEISSILNIADTNKYLYDLNKLKQFIKCKWIKQ